MSPVFRKEEILMRMAVASCEQLCAGLRFLATEKNCEDLKYSVVISTQALGSVISETLRAINTVKF
jgi:hypothetical protein